MKLQNKIIKVAPVRWKSFKFLQTDKLKSFPVELAEKMRESMMRNQFVQSFKVWQNGKDVYCLDGYHRCMILRELEDRGIDVPDLLSGEFINCKNKSEAARLVLLYSSSYTTINKGALSEFLTEHDVEPDVVSEEINLLFSKSLEANGDDAEEQPAQKAEFPITPKFSERYDYAIIMCKNDVDFTNLSQTLRLRMEKSNKNIAVGVSRVVTFERFMELWNARK